MDATDIVRNRYVSKYPIATSFVCEKVLLIEELKKIKSGYYSSLIDDCRSAYRRDEKEYANLKSKLPAVTFCGLFNGAHKSENLIHYNNIVIIDIDHIPEEQIVEVKFRLFSDKYIFACWISPSGNGLKALVRIESNPVMHKFYFDRILNHLFANYNIEGDPSGSDICRLCFISYDTDLLYKEHSEIFPMQEDEWMLSLIAEEKNQKINKLLNPFDKRQAIYTQSEKILFFKTEGRNKRSNREMSKKIISYLRKTRQSITETYPDWLKVALAIANTFTYDVGKNVFLEFCRLDGPLHDEYKSEYLLQYCYRKRRLQEVNFGTIVYLASKKGFIVSPLN